MLPFSKRKNQSDEVELGEDDFELVELVEPSQPASASLSIFGHPASTPSAPSATAGAPNPRNADFAQTLHKAPRARTVLPVSRRILDEDVEEDVAGQCLASIAAETSRDGGDPYSSSHIRAALARPTQERQVGQAGASAELNVPRAVAPPIPAASAATSSSSSTSRLPSVSAPPFLRTTRTTGVPFRGYNDAPGLRDSSPPPAFVRRSSPVLVAAIPAAAPSSYVAVVAASAASGVEGKGNAGSVAPVALSMTQRSNEPTVIVLRERPRAAWIFAAAAIGALGAIGATRFLAAPAAAQEVPAPVAAATQIAPVLLAAPSTAVVAPSTAVVAPPSAAVIAPPSTAFAGPASTAHVPPATSAGAGQPPAIVHFGDDQGVAIKSPAPRRPNVPPPPSAAPAAGAATVRSTGPRAPSMGPALPDGSFGLGRSDTPATASVAPPAQPLTASAILSSASEPPHKRALTPEQQLAAAQLKASMK